MPHNPCHIYISNFVSCAAKKSHGILCTFMLAEFCAMDKMAAKKQVLHFIELTVNYFLLKTPKKVGKKYRCYSK